SGPELSPQELYDRVILASLVERETRDHREMPRVAGVFENRLSRGMRLESCASVQYLLGKPKERLQLEDVRIPSPYNTYLHPGLPPGPIASPGVAALSAALSPERHDYLFFFALEDGSHRHRFSRSFAEHLRARREQARHP
ncbi:MAG TPA: endolytic transglycosylase MltG, partial [Myxococcota bacterium]|nr:endolytic transglycosylase MltG [Myxococcota bacterium]